MALALFPFPLIRSKDEIDRKFRNGGFPRTSPQHFRYHEAEAVQLPSCDNAAERDFGQSRTARFDHGPRGRRRGNLPSDQRRLTGFPALHLHVKNLNSEFSDLRSCRARRCRGHPRDRRSIRREVLRRRYNGRLRKGWPLFCACSCCGAR